MSKKQIDKVNEPAETFEITSQSETTSEEIHPILIQLLEKSIQEVKDGKTITHEEAMRRINAKIQSLK